MGTLNFAENLGEKLFNNGMEALKYWKLFISSNGLSHERVKQKNNRRKLGPNKNPKHRWLMTPPQKKETISNKCVSM